MKLTDIKKEISPLWAEKGYQMPQFDIEAVREKTQKEPVWVHFGAGNLFRAFPAAVLQQVLDTGKYDKGVIVAEGFDFEIIDKAYRPYDNLSLLVCLQSDGTIQKKVIASVTESLKADAQFREDWMRLAENMLPLLMMTTGQSRIFWNFYIPLQWKTKRMLPSAVRRIRYSMKRRL